VLIRDRVGTVEMAWRERSPVNVPRSKSDTAMAGRGERLPGNVTTDLPISRRCPMPVHRLSSRERNRSSDAAAEPGVGEWSVPRAGRSSRTSSKTSGSSCRNRTAKPESVSRTTSEGMARLEDAEGRAIRRSSWVPGARVADAGSMSAPEVEMFAIVPSPSNWVPWYEAGAIRSCRGSGCALLMLTSSASPVVDCSLSSAFHD
jgi:hypothetical protein